MEEAVLSTRISQPGQGRLRRRLDNARGRMIERLDRVRFPEAASADEHWQRAVMNAAVDEQIASLDPPACRAAEISGDGHAGKPWGEFTNLAYPDFDLCAPLEDQGGFDVVICEQVLEHVADPCAAARNLRGLCVPGGHVIVTTPFLIKVHELPYFGMRDYWRFTPRGLETLLDHAGLEVYAVGAWGNRQCIVGNLGRWSAKRWWHSLANEPDVPVQVWAFARRPEAA